MKEKILNAFKNLGFEMNDLDDLGYEFDYEGLHFLWINNKDEEFFSLAVPAVYEKPDSEELEFYQVIDRLNSTLKYVKANEFGNSMWLYYEREMIGEEDFEKLLPKMILHLEHAVRFLRSEEDANSGDDDDETISSNRDNDEDSIIGDVDLLSDNN